MLIDGIRFNYSGPAGTEMPEQEMKAYVQRGKELYGKELSAIHAVLMDEEVELDYTLHKPPFERIRRITGYLVGTTDRFNDAKKAEEAARVKHGLEP